MEKKKDLVAGIFFMCLSVIYILSIIGAEAPIQATSVAGGGKMMPYIVGSGMMICGGILTISSWRQLKKIEATGDGKKKAPEEKQKDSTDYRCVVAVLVAFAVYVGILSSVGFLISTILFLWVTMFLLDKESKKHYLQYTIVSVAAGVLIQVIFVRVLQLALPAGSLFQIWG